MFAHFRYMFVLYYSSSCVGTVCLYSLVNSASHNTNVENLSVQVMLQLPTGENTLCSVPAIVVMPESTSTVTDTVLPQSVTTLSSQPGGVETYVSHVASQPLLSLNTQAPLGIPVVVSCGSVVGNVSQPGGVFDMQESGLTALGIAASTREVAAVHDRVSVNLMQLFYIHLTTDILWLHIMHCVLLSCDTVISLQ